MNGSVIGQHLLISLIPWLVGITVGGGLGYACARVAGSLFSTYPCLRRASMILPWRTFMVTSPLLSLFIPILVGLGNIAGMLIVGLSIFLFAVPFTVSILLSQWYPLPLIVRLIAGARTLAAASVTLALLAGIVSGGGGAGRFIMDRFLLLEYPQVLRAFSIVVITTLMIDILLGTLQMLSLGSTRKNPSVQGANGDLTTQTSQASR